MKITLRNRLHKLIICQVEYPVLLLKLYSFRNLSKGNEVEPRDMSPDGGHGGMEVTVTGGRSQLEEERSQE